MNSIAADIAGKMTLMIEAVGRQEIKPIDALPTMLSCVIDKANLCNMTALWQLINLANDVLAEILPEQAEVIDAKGDRSGPEGTLKVVDEFGAKIVVRSVMNGLKILDTNVIRRQGACEILVVCPSPIENSNTPFADARGQWDHTHTNED